MMHVPEIGRALERPEPLIRFRDENGRELLDVPGAPLPDAETPAPVRFLPKWDNVLLAWADRTRVLPEQYRKAVIRMNGDIALTILDRSRGEVVMPLVDYALGVGRDGIVDEHIDVVLCPEQRTDVAVQREVGLPGPFDGLDDAGVGSVHQVSHLTTDVLLPA